MRTLTKQKNIFQKLPASSPVRHYTSVKYGGVRNFEQTDEWIKIGKYKILLDEVLGKGYSSCVYKGVEVGKELKRYAIKVIQLKSFNATWLKLFKKEIEIHKNLDHQHIAKINNAQQHALRERLSKQLPAHSSILIKSIFLLQLSPNAIAIFLKYL